MIANFLSFLRSSQTGPPPSSTTASDPESASALPSTVAPYRRTSSLSLKTSQKLPTTRASPSPPSARNKTPRTPKDRKDELPDEADTDVSLDLLDESDEMPQGSLANYAPRGPSFILSKHPPPKSDKQEV